MSFDFTSSHVENIELVLVTVEAEHVGNSNISSVDIVVQCQGGIDRNVCTSNLKLKAVDEICEGGITEKTVACADTVFKSPYAPTDILLNTFDVVGKMTAHGFVHGFFPHTDNVAIDIFVLKMAFLVGHLDIRYCHVESIVGWVEGEHL